MRYRNIGMTDLIVTARRIRPGDTFAADAVPSAQLQAWIVAGSVRLVPRRKKEPDA